MRNSGVNTSAEQKYSEAVSLYSSSDLSIKSICERTGVGFGAFSAYLSRYHRELIIKRHNLTEYFNVKLRGHRGQTTAAHYKYKDAIAACDNIEYIEYNISQIARIFDVGCTSLANQLRKHYPDIIPRRELERRKRGIHSNLQYGVRSRTKDVYAAAVKMLQSSDMTIEEVSNECKVPYSGLREHILAYYPQITQQREQKRVGAVNQKVRGKRNGNWSIHKPNKDTIAKYETAIELYRSTSKTMEEIVVMQGVNLGGFRHYLRKWHPGLIVQRRGFDTNTELAQTKRYSKQTAEKYAKAIEVLRNSDLPTARVAAEFGLHPDMFRAYVREHYPSLIEWRGMTTTENGKIVSNRSKSKYAEALQLYETTPKTLKSIAQELGLTYNSVSSYIRRNHPDAIVKHKTLLQL